MRRVLRWLGSLVALACVLILAHAPALRAVASFMAVGDVLAPAALILPLGDPAEAAALFEQGLGEEVAIWNGPPSRIAELGLVPPEHERARSALQAAGVPGDRIVLLPGTIRDREALGRAAGAHVAGRARVASPRRIIAVVDAPWSRLTRRDLRRGLAGTGVEVLVRPTPDRTIDPARWWRTERGLITYLDAWVLWMLRWVPR